MDAREQSTSGSSLGGVEGVAVRHSRRCPTAEGASCGCVPSFQAQVWSARQRKPIRKTFKTMREAKHWRQEAQVALRRGELGAPSDLRVHDAIQAWLDGARAGVVRTRSGRPYKPSTLRGYEQTARAAVLPRLGQRRLSALDRALLQDLIDDLV